MSVNSKIGRYRIEKKIGEGNMGVVYLAHDPYIDRAVALKISKDILEKSNVSDFAHKKNFFHEARSAGRLQHANICAVYDADVDEDACYLVMEFINGKTVKHYCSSDSLLSFDKVVDLVFSVSRALDYAHAMQVVHRDIKPSNILIDENGTVKLSDFGIALLIDGTVELNCVGTPHYMAPEVIIDHMADGRSDIFSLGCVMYELLHGKYLFRGDGITDVLRAIASPQPISHDCFNQDLPDCIKRILVKALEKNPADRYQACSDLSYDLKSAARQLQQAVKESDIEDVVDYVWHMSFFSSFSRMQVDGVLKAAEIKQFVRGKEIVREGDVDDALFIILSGTVEVLKKDSKITEIEKGDCFGEMAYLMGQPRDASVRARTHCVLLKISATLMDRAPEDVQLLFLQSFSRMLAKRVSGSNDIILSLNKRLKLVAEAKD
ncbi:MAG: protein kinase [Deltaproteobacteria bacterium]|nr:protein kinase [Deltaproteobacteria bacterium]